MAEKDWGECGRDWRGCAKVKLRYSSRVGLSREDRGGPNCALYYYAACKLLVLIARSISLTFVPQQNFRLHLPSTLHSPTMMN